MIGLFISSGDWAYKFIPNFAKPLVINKTADNAAGEEIHLQPKEKSISKNRKSTCDDLWSLIQIILEQRPREEKRLTAIGPISSFQILLKPWSSENKVHSP